MTKSLSAVGCTCIGTDPCPSHLSYALAFEYHSRAGRLAMLAVAGMVGQELATQQALF